MNKTLKIALIFIAFAVALYAIFELGSGKKTVLDDNILSENFDAAHDQIVYSWDTAAGFNADMYQKHKNSIAYLEKNNYITAGNASTLRGTLRDNSAKKVCAAYKTELKKLRSIRNESQVIMNKNGMDTIAKDFGLKTESSSYYKEVCEIHKVYCDIKKFNYAVAPSFNPDETPMWKSFNALKSSKKRIADGHKSNQYYKDYMTEIAEFSSKLNIDARLNNAARDNFYNKLRNELLTYFQSIYNSGNVAEENRDKLGTAHKSFKDEYTQDDDLMNLKTQFDDYLSNQNNVNYE